MDQLRQAIDADAGSGEAKSAKAPRNMNLVPVAGLETIRKRLGLSMADFSHALGYASGTSYSQAVRAGKITKTTALAAECLSRRQAPGGGGTVFLVRIVKGMPTTVLLEDLEPMTIGGKSFLLVPQDAGR